MSYVNVLSLGAGVQSTTVLMLSAEGMIPKFDAAIFADTMWEPELVYEHLARLEREIAMPAGIPILRVSRGNLREDTFTKRSVSPPLYIKRVGDTKNGGMGFRGCTSTYKVQPVRQAVRSLLGVEKGRRVPAGSSATMSIGISMDELQRAKDSKVPYIKHEFPLLDLKWTRQDCITYLASKGFGSTPKSACIACPYHANHQWKEMRDTDPLSWADAVDFDAAIRKGSGFREDEDYNFYVHRSCVPLPMADLDAVSKRKASVTAGTITLFEEEEVGGCSPFECRGDGGSDPANVEDELDLEITIVNAGDKE